METWPGVLISENKLQILAAWKTTNGSFSLVFQIHGLFRSGLCSALVMWTRTDETGVEKEHMVIHNLTFHPDETHVTHTHVATPKPTQQKKKHSTQRQTVEGRENELGAVHIRETKI